MSDQLSETAADVAALIPRYSWEIMDEEQRDELMENVVLPRHGHQTSDGTTLTYAWWAEAVGTTKKAVEGRITRLRAKNTTDDGSTRAAPEPNSRTERAAITLRDPDNMAEVLRDPGVREAVSEVVHSDPEFRASVMRSLDTDRETRSDRPTPTNRKRQQHDLVREFQRLHGTVDHLARLVVNGEAIVSEDEREALLAEVRWLRSALDHVEAGLDAGSLDQELAALLGDEA